MSIYISDTKSISRAIRFSNTVGEDGLKEFNSLLSKIGKQSLILHCVSKRKTLTLRFYITINPKKINKLSDTLTLDIKRVKINTKPIDSFLTPNSIKRLESLIRALDFKMSYESINMISNGGGNNALIESILRSIVKIYKFIQQVSNIKDTENNEEGTTEVKKNPIISIFSKNNIKVKERKKVGGKGARRPVQFSKR